MRNSTATSQSAATATTETFYPHTELLQPAQSQRQLQRAAPDAYTADEDEDDEMEYSEETIAKLLKEAEDRLHSKAAALNVNSAVASVSSPSPPALK